MPGELIGKRIDARADAQIVKLYWRGELIKVPAEELPRRLEPGDHIGQGLAVGGPDEHVP